MYMYPDLSYMFHDLFGTAPDNALSIFKTFGLFLALAFLGSAYVLHKELKRKTELGQFKPEVKTITMKAGIDWTAVLWNAVLGFFVGYKLMFILNNFQDIKSNPAGALFSTEGVLWSGLLLAAVMAAMKWWSENKNKLEEDKTVKRIIEPQAMVGDITVVAAISGLIGARAFSIFENLDDFMKDPLGQLFSGSGMTIYGGLILAFIVTAWYVKKRGLKTIHMMDAVAPALIIGYAIGRLGCHFSGDGDWGIVNTLAQPDWWFLPDWMWAHDYPRNVVSWDPANVPLEDPSCVGDYCHKLKDPVWPTPWYESIASFAIFGVLWALRKRLKVAGALFFIYLIFNGIERFFIEFVRVNPRYEYFGVNWSQAQFIAIGLFFIGVAGLIYLYSRARRTSSS